MPRFRTAVAFAILAGLTFASCGDDPTSPPPEPSAAVSAFVETPADAVSRAFAMAMRDAQVRADLRDAMRSSPFNEHKLVLQEYLATSRGKLFLERAAAAASTTVDALRSDIEQLPDMDLYLPYRNHRLTWRASDDIQFAYTMDVDADAFVGFRIDGERIRYRTDAGTPTDAILIIHPAEYKARRIHPQAAGPGPVVQDEDDGEGGGSITWTDHVSGDSFTVELADLVTEHSSRMGLLSFGDCDPDTSIIPCDDDNDPGPQPSDTTLLKEFTIYFSDGIGTAEVEFRAEFYDSIGSLRATMTSRYVGIVTNVPHFGGPLIFRRMRHPVERIRVHVWETDFLWDDYMGYADIRSGDRNKQLSVRLFDLPTAHFKADWTLPN